MNVADEAMTDDDKIRDMTITSSATSRFLRYLPPDGIRTSNFDPKIIKFNLARDLVTEYEDICGRYITAQSKHY